MSFVVFRELAKAYEPHWKLENETSPAFVPSCIPPAMSQRESLEKVLNEIAEAPVQDLSTCSSQLLQKVRDKVSIIISQDQATESASRYSGPQAAQACISVINGPPAPGPSAPGPSAEGFDANKKANALVNTLLKNLDHVSKFVTRDVGEILRDGIRQSHEDPRIEDVGRMVKPTEFDELRFVLGSLSLSDDYDRFKLGTGKTTKHSSQRAFGATCGIKDCHKLRHGLDFGKKIRKLVLDYGNGIIAFLVFVKWHIAKEEDLVRFGRLCVTEKKIKHLIPTTADFITRCLDVYRTVVQERRIGIAKQPVQRKRKRPTTLARPHHANGNQQSRRCTPGLPVGPNATDQHLSVATEKIPTGRRNFGTGALRVDSSAVATGNPDTNFYSPEARTRDLFRGGSLDTGVYPPRATENDRFEVAPLDTNLYRPVSETNRFEMAPLDAGLYAPGVLGSEHFLDTGPYPPGTLQIGPIDTSLYFATPLS